MTSLASNPAVLYTAIGLCGVIAGPFALRFILGLAPGSLKERAAKWQLHRSLNMGDGWLVHQDGDRSYRLTAIDTDSDSVTVEGESVALDNLGHISTKTGSIPMGVSYGPGAVEESQLVGVSPDSHVESVPGHDDDSDDTELGPRFDEAGGEANEADDGSDDTGLGPLFDEAGAETAPSEADDGGDD